MNEILNINLMAFHSHQQYREEFLETLEHGTNLAMCNVS